jgi:hypothetical protein
MLMRKTKDKRMFERYQTVLLYLQGMTYAQIVIRDYQPLANTSFPKGQQKKIPTFGKHRGVKLLGTLDYESGEVFCIEEEQYDAQIFLSFLEKTPMRIVDRLCIYL